MLLKEKCSQNLILTFIFPIYPLGVTGGGGDSYTAILCINEPIPVIILQEV